MFVAGRELTVGMSAYGNLDTTRRALDCLKRSVDGDHEVILVDDCSPDDGAVYRAFLEFKTGHKRTRVFRFERNLEYSGSLNAILSHATGKDVLFLSNDIYITEPYIREVLAAARCNERYGIIRGCSNYVDTDKATHTVNVDLAIKSPDDLAKAAAALEREFGGQVILDNFLTGDAFLVRRAVIERIGTLDPMFYGYFADHDYGLRAQAAGFELVLARGAFAYHHRFANFDYLPEREREIKMAQRWNRVLENWARFKLKYGLPVDLLYHDIDELPWADLSARIGDRFYVPPGDYSRFEIDV